MPGYEKCYLIETAHQNLLVVRKYLFKVSNKDNRTTLQGVDVMFSLLTLNGHYPQFSKAFSSLSKPLL